MPSLKRLWNGSLRCRSAIPTSFSSLNITHGAGLRTDVAAEARNAERFARIDPRTSLLYLRRTLEFALQWIFTADTSLNQPHEGLGYFMRSLVGLDPDAVKESMTEFIAGTTLTASQLDFVNMIVQHLTRNGVMEVGQLGPISSPDCRANSVICAQSPRSTTSFGVSQLPPTQDTFGSLR